MSAGGAANQPSPAPLERVETAPAEKTPEAPAATSFLDDVLTAKSVAKSGPPSPAGPSQLDEFLGEPKIGRSLELWLGTSTARLPEQKDDLSARLNRDIARIDALLNQQVNAVIHHPRFQQLEASWRGLQYLTEQAAETDDQKIEIRVLNCSWKDLARDVEQAMEFDQSQIFRKVYSEEFGTPGGVPYGVLLGDYQIRHQPREDHPYNDIEILTSVSHVAAAAFAPFITSAHPSFLGLDSFTELEYPLNLERTFEQLEYLKWKSFRDSEDARFVGLTLPHVLMRKPHEDGDGAADGFRFVEDVESPDRKNYLWGNACYGFGEVLIRAFADCGWLADIRGFQRGELGGGLVAGLPSHSFSTDAEGVAPKCSTDGIVTEQQERDLGDLGFIPLSHNHDTEFAVFFENHSAQKPKKYDEMAATINSRMSAMLQYMLCVSRFAHYVKVIGRDKVGSLASAEEVESMLHNWLNQYVTSDDDASPEVKAVYPLREAGVQIREMRGKPGCYQCVVHLRPHYQLDEMNAAVKLVTEIAPPS